MLGTIERHGVMVCFMLSDVI